MALGQIYKIHSDFYYVYDGTQSFECKIREVLKKQKERIMVGDFVEFGSGVIENIIERKNYISRPSVANVDQIVIVSALKEPDLNESFNAKVTGLLRYNSFEDMFKDFDISILSDKSMTKEELIGVLEQFYTKEKQEQYGVLGIRIELV